MIRYHYKINLSTLATDSSGKLDVFRHDGDTLGMDGAQVGVFKQAHQVCLTGLLQHKKHYLQQINIKLLLDDTVKVTIK